MGTDIFQELRQRKVFRAAGLYVVVAWVIAQTGEILTQALSLPEWTLTLIVVLLALGFPVALVFAWIFDVTPEGLKLDSTIDRGQQQPGAGRALDFIVIGILVIAVSYFGKEYFTRPDQPAAVADGHSIAVLPFDNLSDDATNDYFSDGVTEELLNALARIPGLKVAARTSSFFFKDKKDDLRRIGEQLGVETILEGSVRRDGDQVRITAQLINTEDGFHLWSRTFDYRMENVFAIQDDIARAVVKELKITLLGEQRQATITSTPTSNSVAYQANLRGRYELHRRMEESIVRAGEFFRAAIDADPKFAAPWVGLAESYVLQYTNHKLLSREEAVAKADDAIRRALDLNTESAEAYAALGLIRMEAGEWDKAQPAFERSLQLNPRYAEAWHWYGLLDRYRGELEESYEKLTTAVEIDPLHPVARANLGQNMLARGLLDEATDFFAQGTELDPDFPNNYLILGLISANAPWADPRKALGWTNAALARGADNIEALGIKVGLYLTLNDLEAAEQTIDVMQAIRPNHPNTIFTRISPLLYRGESGQAAAVLDETLAAHGSELGDAAHLLSAIANTLRGDHESALEAWYRYDARFGGELPRITGKNQGFATLVAWSQQQLGQTDRAARMLDALEAYSDKIPPYGPEGRQLTGVEIATLRGDYDHAIEILEDAVANGYRNRLARGNWLLADYPLFEPLRRRPEFVQAVATIESYNRQFVQL